MAQAQNVIDAPNRHATFMVWQFKENSDAAPVFAKLCALIANLNHSAETRYPNRGVSAVLGIGHDAWLRLNLPQPLPKELKPFSAIKGSKHTAVATPGDLHLHLRADDAGIVYDMAAALTDLLLPAADCIEEVHGFRYHDGRSVIGFVDGTENPQGAERTHFAVVGEEDAAYEGGSYLFVQKYRHDMQAWRALPVSEQEKVIGRSKADDIEMDDDTKPANAHTALANIGDDFKVVRDNLPFGKAGSNEMGTYFICYASTFSTVEKMLTNMFVGSPQGNYDRLLDFSSAQTGTLFFVPSADMLDEFAG
ncbi:MAG: Dyp-type peroxidase [Neisseria sp.]|nr:Dyp-type peroxidase [Neisseria sp.]